MIVKTLAFALLLLVILWARVFYGSMQDYRTGETLLKENQIIRAITYFDRSLHWYVPLNPYMERSAKRLWEIGEKAEKEGDARMARIAFESIRGGFYAASHFIVPGKNWIDRVDTKLEELGERAGRSSEKPKDPHPSILWSVVVVIGFFGWIGSVVAFIVFVLGWKEASGAWATRPTVWIGLGLFFFSLWILAMAMA